MKDERVLDILRQSGALLDGHFELRSKLHSPAYFQCANVLRYPRLAGQLCEALVEKMKIDLGRDLHVDGVISPAMGGIIVGHEIARILDVVSIFAEKEEGVLKMRRFDIARGQRLIVAEDVITRGGRVDETIKIVEDAGGVVAAIAVLVDRSGGKARFNYPSFSLLGMEPVTYEPGRCPLCAAGGKAVHPGSK